MESSATSAAEIGRDPAQPPPFAPEALTGAKHLVLTTPGRPPQIFAVRTAAMTVGRGAANEVILRDARASRVHARLEWGADGCTLVDLDSANGTRVNGDLVQQAAVQPGDVISIGDSSLRLEAGAAPAADEMQPIASEAALDATLAAGAILQTVTNRALPRLTIFTPDQTWELPLVQDSLVIGRQADCDIVIPSGVVSRQHATIERRGDAFVVRDLGSRNGIWRGAARVEQETLQAGVSLRIGPARLIFKPAASDADLTVSEAPARVARPAVVIVPGIMGSELWQGTQRVWPNPRLLFTHPEIFQLPADDPDHGNPLDPRRILGEVTLVPNLVKLEQYDRLGDFLEESLGYARGKDLLEFAYDWRRDVRLSARRLAATIDAWNVKPPLVLIAHSLGTLVSRYYVEHLGGQRKVGRLILVGGPHSGTPKAITTLLQGPDLLPLGLLGETLRQVLASFPSAYQILPTYACLTDQAGRAFDLTDAEVWPLAAQRAQVRAGLEFRRELGNLTSVPTVSIFGYGLKTITGLTMARAADGAWANLEALQADAGDGSVPASSAVLEGSEIHPVQQYHGALYVDNDVKMRLKLELTAR
jgi:pSer/pThr/pTyr-binding forkhead associated (FHA) protein